MMGGAIMRFYAWLLLLNAAGSSYPTGPQRAWESPPLVAVHRDSSMETSVMPNEPRLQQFNKLLSELSCRSFASADIAWQCDIFLPHDFPEVLFLDHPAERRAAFRGFMPDMRIEHRLCWEAAADLRLLDELARCLVEQGHTFEDPPIRRDAPLMLHQELHSSVDGQLFDWTWIARLLDFVAEIKAETPGIHRKNRAWPLITGVIGKEEEGNPDNDSLLEHRTRIESRRLLQTLSQLEWGKADESTSGRSQRRKRKRGQRKNIVSVADRETHVRLREEYEAKRQKLDFSLESWLKEKELDHESWGKIKTQTTPSKIKALRARHKKSR